MITFIDKILKKMGIAFGIIFKIIIPALLFYYPFKMLMFGYVLLSTYYGFSVPSISQNSQLIATFIWLLFVLLLIFAPKAASVLEFILAPLYYLSLYHVYGILFNTEFYTLSFKSTAPFMMPNKICAIAMVVFLFFKILFLLFIILNRKNMQKPDDSYADDYYEYL